MHTRSRSSGGFKVIISQKYEETVTNSIARGGRLNKVNAHAHGQDARHQPPTV